MPGSSLVDDEWNKLEKEVVGEAGGGKDLKPPKLRAEVGSSPAEEPNHKKFDFFYKRTCFRLFGEFYRVLY